MPEWSIPHYATIPLEVWFFNAFFSLLGLVVRFTLRSTVIEAPRREGGGFRLGIVGDLVTAVTAGLLVNHNVLYVTLAAMAAPEVMGALLRLIPRNLERSS